MTALAVHPDAAALRSFALGRLPEDHRAEVEAHVAACGDCGRILEGAGGDSLLDLARRAAMSTPAPAGSETLGPDVESPPELSDHPRYRILGKLGAGGMGVVYKAEHRVMGRLVALKVLSPRTTAKRGAVDRFRREVRLASRLSHPNIVTAHDADEAGGLHFLVMEYVDGMSLDKLLDRKGSLPVTTVCHFIRQASLGLQHAFERGMVHRDIKPQNIMVTRKGAVKVLDFGLACVARDGDEATSATAAKVTSPDMVMGTPDFLAPEQAKCAVDVDIRADLYGMGGTLCYLLTGQPPFPGGTAFEKLMAHVTEPPPDIAQRRPEIPAALAAIVSKLLAKEPADRFATPAELAAVLLPFTKAATGNMALVPVLDAEVVAPFEAVPAFETMVEAPAKPRKKKAKKQPVPFYAKHRSKLIAAGIALALLAAAGFAANRLSGNRPDATASNPPTKTDSTNTTAISPAKTGQPSVLMVLAPNNLYLPDYHPVREELERNGVRVQTASMSKGPCEPHETTPGAPVVPDLAIKDVDPTKYDAVIFIGAGVWPYTAGPGAEDVRRIIGSLRDRGKIVAAICIGAQVLHQHNIINLQTVVPGKKFENSGVNRNGQVITGGTYTDAVPFAKEVVRAVKK